MAATIIDQSANRGRFLAVLVAAELNASTPWEFGFTNDMRERFEQQGGLKKISVLQLRQLRRIAGE